MPVDMKLELAKQQAHAQSIEKKEPVAIIKEGDEYRCLNAFAAYSGGYTIADVVSVNQ